MSRRDAAAGMRLLLGAVLLVGLIPAQLGRYEMGRRLRLFEQAWEQADDAARARATPHLDGAVRAFFALNAAKATQGIEAARGALASSTATWADALALAPAARLLDPRAAPLVVTIASLFDTDAEPPPDARVRCELLGKWQQVLAPAVEVPLGATDTVVTLECLRVANGDHTLRGTFLAGGQAVATAEIGVSIVHDLTTRLARIDLNVDRLRKEDDDVAASTQRYLRGLLRAAAEGKTAETDLPYSRMLEDARGLDAQERDPITGRLLAIAPPGESWLCIATARRRIPLRLFVPPRRTASQKVPLVVALHGAGGSENMFFDAYGAGKIVALARARDWIVVAPANAADAVDEIVEQLALLTHVDRSKVFLVGHSMGAMQAVAAGTGTHAMQYAAVVALGGGGRVPPRTRLYGRAFFVGVGALDFARAGALTLREALGRTEAAVHFVEYPDTEHLAIVQRALPDVFAWLDAIAEKR